jgi:hypothetical protein
VVALCGLICSKRPKRRLGPKAPPLGQQPVPAGAEIFFRHLQQLKSVRWTHLDESKAGADSPLTLLGSLASVQRA